MSFSIHKYFQFLNSCKGYRKAVLSDLLKMNPQVKTIKLDVQERNKSAVMFYEKIGFQIYGEEYQPVNGENIPYYNMVLNV